MSSLAEKLMAIPAVVQAFQYYQSLERRDQLALKGLSAFLALLLVYFALWQPINNFRDEGLSDRDTQLSLLSYMRQTEAEARAASQSGGNRQLSGQSLLTQVSSTAQRYGIKANRLQPEGDSAVSVWFDNVAFNDLIRWLQHLERSQGIVVRQLSVDRQEKSGRVNARIVLRS